MPKKADARRRRVAQRQAGQRRRRLALEREARQREAKGRREALERARQLATLRQELEDLAARAEASPDDAGRARLFQEAQERFRAGIDAGAFD